MRPSLGTSAQRRLNSYQRGYTHRWDRVRRLFLLANPTCVKCGRLANTVDHIRPHRGSRALFWDVTNWQPMCARCHSRKTVTRDGGWGRSRVA